MYKSPSWSPDGEFLVVTRQTGLNEVIDTHRADMTPPEAPQTDPVTVDRPERAKRRRPRKQPPDGPPVDLVILRADGAGFARMLTGRWELIPANPSWSPDGDAILFTAATAGDSHLFLVPTAGGSVEQVTGGARRLGAVSFDAEFSRVAFSVADSAHPSEIYTAAIDGSSERRLSGFNDRLTGEVGFREAERISFPSAAGTEIEGWILTPPGYDPAGSYPLILAIHGGPHSAYGNSFSFQFQLWAARRPRRRLYQSAWLDRIRRGVSLGDVGRLGPARHRRRAGGRRLRRRALRGRRAENGRHRLLIRRLPDQLDHRAQ